MSLIYRIISKCYHKFWSYLAKIFPSKGTVLMLHWVGDEELDLQYEPYRISTEQCRALLEWLKDKNTIKLEEWENKENFYAVTIDDVPIEFYNNAYQLFKDAGVPFTLFVNVSLLGTKGFITKDQLIEMSECELCTIGSHGITHDMFAYFSLEEKKYELSKSKEELEQIINKPISLYAFPYGSYYACGYTYKHLALKVYKYAFGTVASPITRPSFFKKYFLPRINVDVSYLKKIL